MAVVVLVDAPQGSPARQPEDRSSDSSVVHHLDVDHPSPDPFFDGEVVVGLDEALLPVHSPVPDALEVDELVPLDGRSTALVFPATHLDDDVHHNRSSSGDGGHRTSYELEPTGEGARTVSTTAVATAPIATAARTTGRYSPVAPITAPAAGGPSAEPTAADV